MGNGSDGDLVDHGYYGFRFFLKTNNNLKTIEDYEKDLFTPIIDAPAAGGKCTVRRD